MRNRLDLKSLALLVVAAEALLSAGIANSTIRFDSPLLSQYATSRPELNGSPARAAVGDLNEDGIPDVVAALANGGGGAILLGNGDGTLASPIGATMPCGPGFLQIADFDGDGHADVVGCGFGCSFLYGDGSGQHWTPATYGTAFSNGLVAADFDGDGRPDVATVVASNPTADFHVYLSRPGRTFASVSNPIPLAYGLPFVIRAADFNHDGHMDAVFCSPGPTPDILVMMGHGDGTFTAKPVNGSGSPPDYGMDVADVTGDGNLDLVVTGWSKLTTFAGAGDSTFHVVASTNIPIENTKDLVLADVTGDGVLDAVDEYGMSSQPLGVSVVVHPGLGGGVFGDAIPTAVGHILFGLVVADMNGDEIPDVVTYDTDAPGVRVMLGTGGGHFGEATPPPLNGFPIFGFGSSDMDADGVPDLVLLSNSTVRVFLARPGRTFLPIDLPTIPGGANGPIRFADLDRDGHLDVGFRAPGNTIGVCRGLGGGSLASPTFFSVPSPVYDFYFGDATGDTIPDLIYDSGTNLVARPGLGNGSFGPAINSPLGANALSPLAVGDINGDGRVDAVEAMDSNSSNYELRRSVGVGDGTFVSSPIASSSQRIATIAIADVNGDGRNDLVTTSACDFCFLGPVTTFQTRLQQPNGTLGSAISAPWPANYASGLVPWHPAPSGPMGFVSSMDGGFVMIGGDGDGHFLMNEEYAGVDNAGQPVVSDFDSDGFPDVAVSGDNGRVFWGRDPVVPSVTISAPAPGSALGVGGTASIEWTATDAHGISNVNLFVSRHGPAGPYAPIGTGVPNTGQFSWTATSPLSDSVYFKIVVRDSVNNTSHVQSAGASAILDLTGVDDPATHGMRLAFASVVPNPTRGGLSVRFTLTAAGHASILLYDVQGRRVATLLDSERPAGAGSVAWTPGASRRGMKSGVYFLRLSQGGRSVVTRVAFTE